MKAPGGLQLRGCQQGHHRLLALEPYGWLALREGYRVLPQLFQRTPAWRPRLTQSVCSTGGGRPSTSRPCWGSCSSGWCAPGSGQPRPGAGAVVPRLPDRAHERRAVCARRARLHARLRHPRADQLRPRRRVHARGDDGCGAHRRVRATEASSFGSVLPAILVALPLRCSAAASST